MTVALTHRFDGSRQFQINYALSHARDDVTDLDAGFSAFMPTRLEREWADSTFDVRHTISANAVVQTGAAGPASRWRTLVSDTTVGAVISVHSGLPFTLRIGHDTNGDSHDLYDRPFLAVRNSGRGAWYSSLDARVMRRLPLGADGRVRAAVLAEASNVLNRSNFLAVNDVVGTDPQYLRGPFHRTGSRSIPPTSPLGFTTAAPGRQLQVGFRLLF